MLWDDCDGATQIRPVAGTLYRLVESQEQVATLGYVDTLEEQALLEAMLEDGKPPCPDDASQLHYLLKTPFRYPPLKWGSRFGRRHEPSLFYAGLAIEPTLAEAAYYRFVFWYSMDGEPVSDRIRTEHTLFSARYRTERGIRLHAPPFDRFEASLRHPADYTESQASGTAMRDAGVEAFEYRSARDADAGLCVALFTAKAFASKRPLRANQWLCELGADEVSFKKVGTHSVTTHALATFLHNGELPMPAS